MEPRTDEGTFDPTSAHAQQVARAARRAYERGRVKMAFSVALATVPIAALAAAIGGSWWPLGLGAGLFAVTAVLVWRGQGYAQGVAPGLLAGSLPLAALGIAHLAGHICMPGHLCVSHCLPTALVGGLLAGLWVDGRRNTRGYRASVLGVGIATASLGCAAVGLGGALGLLGGVMLATVPSLVLARPAVR